MRHVLLSQKFPPEFGGSIRWMVEVYRRWPTPVTVVTHDYYNHPPRTPEFPGQPAMPDTGDPGQLGSIKRVIRVPIFLHDWGMTRPGQWRRYLRMTRAVNRLMKETPGPVTVHCTHAVPEVVSLIPLRWRYGKRLRIVCYAHGEEVTACLTSRQLKLLMGRAHRQVDLMIANSEFSRQKLEGLIDPEKVVVQHPGVDLEEWAPAAELGRKWREDHGLTDAKVVLTLGRIDPRKNHLGVIEALGRLAEQGRAKDAVYVVAGEGRALPMIKQRAAELGIESRVRFTGPVDGDLRLAMFGACDVFAMPAVVDGSDVEGFGMVFVEAGACCKPSLSGNVGGQPEAVRDGESGFVVDGTDTAAVTEALGRLIEDEALRERLGSGARRRAEELDWPRVVQRTLELTDKLN